PLSSRRGDNFHSARPQAHRREHHVCGKPASLSPRVRDSAVHSVLIWRCSEVRYGRYPSSSYSLCLWPFAMAGTTSLCDGSRLSVGFSVPLVSKAAVLASLALTI